MSRNSKKPNVFDIKSVFIKHPKTAIKLSKSIKQTKTTTQKEQKTKFYTELEAADCTLQLHIIQIHIIDATC